MIIAYLVTALLTFIISFLTISIFRRLGVVDKPDQIRKIHKGDIPLGGGLVLFLSCSLSLFILFPEFTPGVYGDHPGLPTIWNISIIILLVGLYDDIVPMQPSIRIIVQVIASWLVIAFTDIYLRNLGDLFDLGIINLGAFGIPITIFMVVGVCNAFNMLDGMDGLVAFLLFIPAVFIGILANIHGSSGLIFIGPLILLVFLLFNLGLFGKKWKIFLGDSGAMWLGFLTAWILICLSQNETRYNFPPVTALWFVMIPLVDSLSTFLTRIWHKKSIFHGDRSHLHHALLDLGLNKWQVLSIFIFLTIISSGLGYCFIVYSIQEYYQLYGFLTIWFFYHLLIKQPIANKDNS